MSGGPIWKSLIGDEEVTVDRSGGIKLDRVGGFVPGCDECIHRISGARLTGLVNVTGRAAIAIFPNVNGEETRAKRHMIGKAATWAWDVLKDYGVSREQFDITSAVRCEPAEPEPSKEEFARCSSHTKLFIRKNAGQSKTWIIWGKQTGEYVLGKGKARESPDPIYWSERYGARIFLMENPGPYQRSSAYPKHLAEMNERRYEAAAYSIKKPGQFSFVESLDIKGVWTPGEVIKVIREAQASGEVVVHDIEDFENQILCIGFSWKKQHARVVVLDHPENKATKEEREQVWRLITEYLASSTEKAFHFGASDTIKLEQRGIDVNGFTVDTLFGHFLKYSYVLKHGLASIALDRFPHYAGYKELVSQYYNKDKYPRQLAEVPLRTLILYNGADCCLTWEIKEHILSDNQVDRNLLYIYVRASRVIYRMEARGPLLDREHVAMLRAEFPRHLDSMLRELRDYAGKVDYNPGSWQQVAEVMYRTLQLPTVMEIEGGNNPDPDDFKTDEESLNIISEATGSPFVKLQLDYRKMNALMENTVTGAERSAARFGGEVRTKWHLAGAATGRLRSGGDGEGGESVYINMQNLPSNPLGKNILCSFTEWRLVNAWIRDNIASFPSVQVPDWILDSDVFVTRDMSQIEVRLAAEESKDKNLVKAFQDKIDIHATIGTRSSKGKWTWDQCMNDENIRRTAKAVGFSVLYGTKENGLYIRLRAQGVQVTLDEVADLLRGYFQEFSGVTDLMAKLDLEVERTGGITTRFGFRRHIGEDYQGKRKSSTKNQPLNTLIQSSAHTLMLLVQCLIDEDPIKYELLTRMTMEIHDALYWYVKLRHAPQALKIAKKLMEEEVQDLIEALWGFRFSVPIMSDGGVGYRFGVMAKLKSEEVTVYDILTEWYRANEKVDKGMRERIEKGLRK